MDHTSNLLKDHRAGSQKVAVLKDGLHLYDPATKVFLNMASGLVFTNHQNAPQSLQDAPGRVFTRPARVRVAAMASYRSSSQRRMQEIRDLKAATGCKVCGETHPACLDFHHRDPSTKLFTIGSSSKACKSRERVWAEIAKCDVICSNCHRKEHYNHLGGSIPASSLIKKRRLQVVKSSPQFMAGREQL